MIDKAKQKIREALNAYREKRMNIRFEYFEKNYDAVIKECSLRYEAYVKKLDDDIKALNAIYEESNKTKRIKLVSDEDNKKMQENIYKNYSNVRKQNEKYKDKSQLSEDDLYSINQDFCQALLSYEAQLALDVSDMIQMRHFNLVDKTLFKKRLTLKIGKWVQACSMIEATIKQCGYTIVYPDIVPSEEQKDVYLKENEPNIAVVQRFENMHQTDLCKERAEILPKPGYY